MKNFFGHIIVLILFSACTFSAVLPNPFIEGTFSKTQWQQVNDFFEVEKTSQIAHISHKIAMLDWQSSANALFAPFENTRIFDITTQKTFIVQRTGGTRHADVEPVDAKNTQIFCEIIETASSPRRAVLVCLSGVWVAASLASQAHGYSLITDNNFEGHLCIHFLCSKTDSTKKTDYMHQKTIKKAYKLGKKIKII